eukprot:8725054-Alexandrium_andersonii.AAC.1
MSTWLFPRRWRSQACAPSCAGASTALGRPLPAGKHCTPPSWRASDSPAGRPVRAASTTRSWTSGASRTGAISLSP